MSEFLLDEAMGYNRRQQMDAVAHLANAGLDDRLYDHDDDFFASRPEPDGQQDGTIVERMPSFVGSEAGGEQQDDEDDPGLDNGEGEVIRVIDDQDDDAQTDYKSARTHQSVDGGQGLIQEDPGQLIQEAPMQPVGGGLGAGRGLAGGRRAGQPERVRINYDDETNPVADFLPKRSNKVLGKYWRTFGERKAAIGGGIGGFFGALFGGGMRRANLLAGARARRVQERAGEVAPQRGLLRSRLANEGQATSSGARGFPQEPGVDYAGVGATRTRENFDLAMSRFNRIKKPNEMDAKLLGSVHTDYDLRRRNRTEPRGNALNSYTNDKFNYLTRANQSWGAISTQGDLQPPRVPQPGERRVRFQDGADDAVGSPVNEFDNNTTKVRPTGVRFHPIPMTSDTRANVGWRERRKLRISDDEALSNERFLWPIRNQLNRLNQGAGLKGARESAGKQLAELSAQNPAEGSDADTAMRTAAFTVQTADDIGRTRKQAAAEFSQSSLFPTNVLSDQNSDRVKAELGYEDELPVDGQEPKKAHLSTFRSTLNRHYFANQFRQAQDAEVIRASRAQAKPPVVGGVGGGIIEEEELQQ